MKASFKFILAALAATAAGALFLPVAGYRSNDSYEGDDKSNKGYYWAATPQAQK